MPPRRSPRRYAAGTTVPVAKSRMEVEDLLTRHGAHQIVIGTDSRLRRGFVSWTVEDRQYKLAIPPRQGRNVAQIEREQWRTLVLLLKGKLEVIASGMVTFDQEFLAYMVLFDGTTVGEAVAPRIAEIYDTGKVVPLLPP